MNIKKFFNYLSFLCLLMLIGIYVSRKKENLKTLENMSFQKEIRAEVLTSQVDSSKKCVYFEGYKRGFHADNLNQNTKFTVKLSEDSKGNSCITEILADGKIFYKPSDDNEDYCVNIKVPPKACSGARRTCSLVYFNCY